MPNFNEYVNAAPLGRVVEFPLLGPSFQLDVDAFAQAAEKANADMAIVVTPNNPTSLQVPIPELRRLADILQPHGIKLIIDESFIDCIHSRGNSIVVSN